VTWVLQSQHAGIHVTGCWEVAPIHCPGASPRQGLIVVSRDLHSSVGNYRWHRGRDRAGWIDQIEPWLIGHLTLRSAELYRRNHLESVHDHDL
jgi:hypothetical protein